MKVTHAAMAPRQNKYTVRRVASNRPRNMVCSDEVIDKEATLLRPR